MPATAYQLLFAANLAFILTNVYGWVLKWFYRPRAYDEEFQRLFPAQRSVGTLYLLQALELPYLIQLGLAATSATDSTFDSALLYANTFALLIFPIQMLIMCESYFFPSKKHPPLHYLLYLPAALLLALLLPSALGLAVLPAAVIPWVKAATALVFLIYFWRSVRMAQKIGNAIRDASEQAYADEDDFPVRFAGRIQWLPIGICAAMAINYLVDDPTFKAVRDVIFTGINVWFCILTLNPWRTVLSPAAERIILQIDPDAETDDAETDETAVENTPPIDRSLSEARLDDLASRLDHLMRHDLLFTEEHIMSDTLCQRLATNTKYLTEAICRLGYANFYDMINQHRVRHAISLINQQPDRLLQDIAHDCGFSKPSAMTRAFKSQGKPAPSTFRRQ